MSHRASSFRGARQREPGIRPLLRSHFWIPGSVLRTAPE
jgi:hypothetical protein